LGWFIHPRVYLWCSVFDHIKHDPKRKYSGGRNPGVRRLAGSVASETPTQHGRVSARRQRREKYHTKKKNQEKKADVIGLFYFFLEPIK